MGDVVSTRGGGGCHEGLGQAPAELVCQEGSEDGLNQGGAMLYTSDLRALGPLAGLSHAFETLCLANSYTSLNNPA